MSTVIRPALFLVLALATMSASAQAQTDDTLRIYLVDVEGGNATLFVSPEGESLLIDTGNGGANADRDVGRIMAAVEDAGLQQIDHLITTHYHGDHYGGMSELATRIPIRHFIDHGPSVEDNARTLEFLDGAYRDLFTAARHTVARPGDTVPLAGVDVTVMASGGQVIQTPLSGGGGSNPYCADFEPQAEDRGENAQSVGIHFRFGQFRGTHLGDLTVNKEFELVCPANPIGTVDLHIVSHHGLQTSNSAALIHAIAPRVALMNNGTRKGGSPGPMTTLHTSPGLEDLWQLHFSVLSGQEYTVPGVFIANMVDDQPATMPLAPMPQPRRGSNAGPPPIHSGPAHWIEVEAQRDGGFTVTNSRNGFSKSY
ncbi:MAG: MBL fold metallo-hydrolase [Acidobacteria bacterium]|nr:MBL fold metallo-hydrolase [Acidobacteriota bacterium]MDP7339719.1 MBL fold metallo-hydrolase [Vicinamibacterales bacterium]MDP7478063.1 MBL fold metallo-hydrolase [Vicinamibacterales bacterium]HJN46795.1 MBL fold metallo-hydrolase [Vicinamibacterales bacterium]